MLTEVESFGSQIGKYTFKSFNIFPAPNITSKSTFLSYKVNFTVE